MSRFTLLQQAVAARSRKDYKTALRLLKELHRARPKDPMVAYQHAWTLDNLGREKEAVAYYRKAIANGLKEPDLKECYLGLGSSLRHLKRYGESARVLEAAARRFPRYPALRVFLGLTYAEAKKGKAAARTLLGVLLETTKDSGIRAYGRALAGW